MQIAIAVTITFTWLSHLICALSGLDLYLINSLFLCHAHRRAEPTLVNKATADAGCQDATNYQPKPNFCSECTFWAHIATPSIIHGLIQLPVQLCQLKQESPCSTKSRMLRSSWTSTCSAQYKPAQPVPKSLMSFSPSSGHHPWRILGTSLGLDLTPSSDVLLPTMIPGPCRKRARNSSCTPPSYDIQP